MSRKCAGLKPTPACAGRLEWTRLIGPACEASRPSATEEQEAPAKCARPFAALSRFDRLERTHALRSLDRVARSLGHILPGGALIVRGRGPGASGSSAGRAVVFTLERNAEAFVHGGLRRLRRGGDRSCDHRQGGGKRTGDRRGGEGAFGAHW